MGRVDDAPDERIELLADAERPGGFVLLIDRVRQSYVDLDDPSYLDFEYMRWFAAALDGLRPGRLAVTHIGGGAGAMPRWIDSNRPGSTHIILEPDANLVDLIRRRLPFARGARVRIRTTPGRPGLEKLQEESADVVILDAFDGARVPADLTTAECLGEVARVLRSDGLFLANVGDGGRLDYSKRFAAGLRKLVGAPVVISEKRVFGGARFGNVVLAASPGRIDVPGLRRRLSAEILPAQVRAGSAVEDWIGGALPFTDADSSRSPQPPEATWRHRAEHGQSGGERHRPGDAALMSPGVAADLPVWMSVQQFRDGLLVGRRAPDGMVVPAQFFSEDAAPVKGLPGVITLLRDARFSDDEIIDWLFRDDESLPGTPIEALRANRGKEIKRRAQVAGY
jgi:hypothetical protein